MIAISHKNMGRYADALKHYNLAIKYFPLDTKLLFNKALCLFSLEEYAKVIKVCEAVLKMEDRKSVV